MNATPWLKVLITVMVFGTNNITAMAIRRSFSSKTSPASWAESPYFNAKILKNTPLITSLLRADGFEPKTLKASDGYTTKALWLPQKNAACTFVVAGGWFRKSLAQHVGPMHHLLNGKKDANDNEQPPFSILGFDNRPFSEHPTNYGHHECKDSIAALEMAQQLSPNQPIIALGTCAGAYHFMRAVTDLGPEATKALNVKGLVFDSGWKCPREISDHAVPLAVRKQALNLLAKIHKGTPHDAIKQGYLYRSITTTGAFGWAAIRDACYAAPKDAGSQQAWHEVTGLQGKMHRVEIPVLIMHGNDDEFAPKEHIEDIIAELGDKAETWFVDNASHGFNHLKHKEKYRAAVTGFANKIVQKII